MESCWDKIIQIYHNNLENRQIEESWLLAISKKTVTCPLFNLCNYLHLSPVRVITLSPPFNYLPVECESCLNPLQGGKVFLLFVFDVVLPPVVADGGGAEQNTQMHTGMKKNFEWPVITGGAFVWHLNKVLVYRGHQSPIINMLSLYGFMSSSDSGNITKLNCFWHVLLVGLIMARSIRRNHHLFCFKWWWEFFTFKPRHIISADILRHI